MRAHLDGQWNSHHNRRNRSDGRTKYRHAAMGAPGMRAGRKRFDREHLETNRNTVWIREWDRDRNQWQDEPRKELRESRPDESDTVRHHYSDGYVTRMALSALIRTPGLRRRVDSADFPDSFPRDEARPRITTTTPPTTWPRAGGCSLPASSRSAGACFCPMRRAARSSTARSSTFPIRPGCRMRDGPPTSAARAGSTATATAAAETASRRRPIPRSSAAS